MGESATFLFATMAVMRAWQDRRSNLSMPAILARPEIQTVIRNWGDDFQSIYDHYFPRATEVYYDDMRVLLSLAGADAREVNVKGKQHPRYGARFEKNTQVAREEGMMRNIDECIVRLDAGDPNHDPTIVVFTGLRHLDALHAACSLKYGTQRYTITRTNQIESQEPRGLPDKNTQPLFRNDEEKLKRAFDRARRLRTERMRLDENLQRTYNVLRSAKPALTSAQRASIRMIAFPDYDEQTLNTGDVTVVFEMTVTVRGKPRELTVTVKFPLTYPYANWDVSVSHVAHPAVYRDGDVYRIRLYGEIGNEIPTARNGDYDKWSPVYDLAYLIRAIFARLDDPPSAGRTGGSMSRR